LFEDQGGGELNEEQVLFRQILTITGIASRMFMDTTTEWQVNVRNYVEAINNLEATSVRHLDQDYVDRMGMIIKRSRAKLVAYREANPKKSLTALGKEYEISLTLEYARRKLALLMKTLDNKGVFTEKSYRAIEQPTSAEIKEHGQG
jgi:hypothetical protein